MTATNAKTSRMLTSPWQLSASVALRPEPFGALAYNFHNRKLSFLKRPELVRVVEHLADHPDMQSTLVAEGIPQEQHDGYLRALQGLATNGMIRPRTDS